MTNGRQVWEKRATKVEVTPITDGLKQDGLPREFWARVVNYGVLDDYKTLFKPGAFTESLERRLPRLMFGHQGWENPAAVLGKAVEYRDSPEGLDMKFVFDDFDYVPMAKQIAHQMTSGTLDEFSVGFRRQAETRDSVAGGTWVTKAMLGEVSSVVMGSVPGTKLLSFRDASGDDIDGAVISADDAVRLLTQIAAGTLDLHEALGEVKTLVEVDLQALDEEDPDDEPDPEDDDEPACEDEPAEEQADFTVGEDALAELDEFLEGVRVADGWEVRKSRVFSGDNRKELASKGEAMPDGSYPIPDKGALRRAIMSYGRAPAEKRAAVKAHIKKRAKALGAEDLLPDDWKDGARAAVNDWEERGDRPGHPFRGNQHGHGGGGGGGGGGGAGGAGGNVAAANKAADSWKSNKTFRWHVAGIVNPAYTSGAHDGAKAVAGAKSEDSAQTVIKAEGAARRTPQTEDSDLARQKQGFADGAADAHEQRFGRSAKESIKTGGGDIAAANKAAESWKGNKSVHPAYGGGAHDGAKAVAGAKSETASAQTVVKANGAARRQSQTEDSDAARREQGYADGADDAHRQRFGRSASASLKNR